MTTAGNQPSSDAGSPREALFRRTALVERMVAAAYERFLLGPMPEGLALLGVGGFGRGELFPHSDVDLLLLVERQSLAERQRPAISAFLQELWDSGLRVSHSVRAPSECCERHDGNLELSISLLDQRYLAGDREPLCAPERRACAVHSRAAPGARARSFPDGARAAPEGRRLHLSA